MLSSKCPSARSCSRAQLFATTGSLVLRQVRQPLTWPAAQTVGGHCGYRPQQHEQAQHRHSSRGVSCCSNDPDRPQPSAWSILPSRFNSVYLAIVGIYAALFLFQNPYIFAALTIATIIPQNSTTTSLNSLVIFTYESGLFMNFAEAVYCVRLVTWLSIISSLIGFALFA